MQTKRRVQIDSLYFFASLGAFFFASWGLLISLLLFMPTAPTALWWIGSVLSFGLALVISLLCLFEIKAKRDDLIAFSLKTEQSQQKQFQELAIEKQQRLQDQKHFEGQTKELTHHYQALIQKQQEGKDQEIHEIRKAYEVLFESEQFLRNQITSLKISLEEALDEARQSKQNYYLLEESSKQKPLEKEATPIEGPDKNLRYQLEEKTEQLNQVRKQLFEIDGSYVLLQKQLLDEPKDETWVREPLQLLSAEIEDLEEENKLLESIVTSLSAAKKSPRMKKSSKSEEQPEPAQLTF